MWQRKRLVARAGLCVRASGKIRLERATQINNGEKKCSFLFQAFAKTETAGAYAIVCVPPGTKGLFGALIFDTNCLKTKKMFSPSEYLILVANAF
jgi:hypothetical protein